MIDVIPFPGVGICYDMPSAVYHKVDACSASALKTISVSPKHEKVRMSTSKTTAPMILGTAVHTATLEPDKLETDFVIAGWCEAFTGKGDKCTNPGKVLCGGRWYCGTHCKKYTPDPMTGIQVLSAEDLTAAKEM